MKFLVAFLCLVVASHGRLASGDEHEPDHADEQLWTAMGEFGHSLLQSLIEQTKPVRNVLISPLSLHSSLSMVVPGARGETKDEMVQTLHLNGIQPKGLRNAFVDLTSRKHENTTKVRHQDAQFTMRLANRIYAQKDYPLAPSYVDEVKSTFHADAVNVNFALNGDKVKDQINDFVKQKTNDLIPKILRAPLDTDTVMVLINALYFKGDWQKKMSEKNVALAFNKGCGSLEKKKHTKWLTVEQRMPYLESTSLNARLLQIPYRSREFSASMLIIMPNSGHSCKTEKWLKGLQWSTVQDEIKKMEVTDILLTMPRFEVGYRHDLQDVLPTMGMSKVFNQGESDLLGMVSDPARRLYISQIIHETKMIVTEAGTEAAAASVPMLTPRSFHNNHPINKPMKITIDRSFYVAILFAKSGANEVLPLLAGVVQKP